MVKYYDYFYLYYHWHREKYIFAAFYLCLDVIFSDGQLMHALGPVIYIQLEGLMNGKAMHVMRFLMSLLLFSVGTLWGRRFKWSITIAH